LRHTRAGGRRHGKGHFASGDAQLVVAGGADHRQPATVIQAAFQAFPLFQLDLEGGARRKVAGQVQGLLLVQSDQRAKGQAVVAMLHLGEAGFDLLVVRGWIAKGLEQAALVFGLDSLRVAVGVDPVDAQARGFTQFGKACIAHAAPSSRTRMLRAGS